MKVGITNIIALLRTLHNKSIITDKIGKTTLDHKFYKGAKLILEEIMYRNLTIDSIGTKMKTKHGERAKINTTLLMDILR